MPTSSGQWFTTWLWTVQCHNRIFADKIFGQVNQAQPLGRTPIWETRSPRSNSLELSCWRAPLSRLARAARIFATSLARMPPFPLPTNTNPRSIFEDVLLVDHPLELRGDLEASFFVHASWVIAAKHWS